MKDLNKIAIIGGGGRTGQFLVKQLLAKDFQLRLLLRNPDIFTISHPNIEIIHGDVLDFDVVDQLVDGCDAVISTVGQRQAEALVASVATRNILQAIEKHQANNQAMRYILLAGINVDTPFDKKGLETHKATDWMRLTFPAIQEDRQKAYAILTESALPWTLVRVPFIEFTDETRHLKVDLEDCLGTNISAADIASFMIRQLTDESYIRKAPFISN